MIIKNMDSLERQPVRTQFLVFTLFGDYILPRGGEIWTGDLLYLLALLGVSERATRSALSRMTRKGWLAANKQGRRSRYSLTARGSTLLESGHRRIFEPVFTDWDGKWQLVVYSLPEEKRSKRHTLRTQLTWLGFGSLTPGAWISPHDRSTELERLFTDLEVGHLVDMFSGPYLGPSSGQKLVTRCWELDGLETKYHDFITRYQPAYIQCRSQNSGALEPEDCFVRRFWLMHEFQAFTLKDPNLPIALLPLNWAGFAARELFDNYRQLLAQHANQYVDAIMEEKKTGFPAKKQDGQLDAPQASTPVQTKGRVYSLIQRNREKIRALGVKKLGLFGSLLYQKQNAESDVDLLVEFERDEKTFDNFMQLSFLLEDLFKRRVELVTPESLSPYLGPKIMNQVEYVTLLP